ncbi:hypothetical protein ACFLZG_00160 [Thermodesulfobacteriota bacterium]
MNITISIIIVLAFFSLWWLIGKFPDVCIKIFPYMRKQYLNEDKLHVFSAETSSGDEAEFTNEGLPDKNKAIKFFRIILFLIFLAVIFCLLFYI